MASSIPIPTPAPVAIPMRQLLPWTVFGVLLAALLVYFVGAEGGIFALAFAFAHGRLGALSARATSVLVATGTFAAIYLVPFVKYPANPPAVGEPDTIARRSALYLLMVLVSVLSVVAAVLLGRMAVARLGTWNAVLVGAGAFVLCVAVAGAVLPGVDEVPGDFPATALWRFRLASVGTQLVLWTTVGLVFGALTERRARRRAAVAQTAAAG